MEQLEDTGQITRHVVLPEPEYGPDRLRRSKRTPKPYNRLCCRVNRF